MFNAKQHHYQHLGTTYADGVCTIALDRPARYNALDRKLLEELKQCFEWVAVNSTVQVIILKGSGAGFCAGLDLHEIHAIHETKSKQEAQVLYEELLELNFALISAMNALPQPIIAQVHGAAAGGGYQLLCGCDLVVAAADAKFSTPGVALGLGGATPQAFLSQHIPRKQALEMTLLGQAITAEQALCWGMINRVVPPDHLEQEALRMADQLSSLLPESVSTGKAVFYQQLALPLEDAYQVCAKSMVSALTESDSIMGRIAAQIGREDTTQNPEDTAPEEQPFAEQLSEFEEDESEFAALLDEDITQELKAVRLESPQESDAQEP